MFLRKEPVESQVQVLCKHLQDNTPMTERDLQDVKRLPGYDPTQGYREGAERRQMIQKRQQREDYNRFDDRKRPRENETSA